MIESLSKKLRLADRDYSAPGWYFVTLGANFHKPLFGCMEESKVVLNDLGRLVVSAWHDLPNHCGDVRLGEFIVMPNHVHGLIRLGPANKLPLGTIMNGFKGQVTRNVNKLEGKRCTVWQQNYHEVIVHGLDQLKAKAAYIKENPVRWALKGVARGVITLNPLPGRIPRQGWAHPGAAAPWPSRASCLECNAWVETLAGARQTLSESTAPKITNPPPGRGRP